MERTWTTQESCFVLAELLAHACSPLRLNTQFALARYLDRLIESGELRSCSTVARLLGITKGRLSQIMALLNLSPDIQEQILTGKLAASKRRVREVVGVVGWDGQRHAL